MKEKRLIIHAGFHKSGTTALQESLHVQRNQLRSLGIDYLDLGKKAHHKLAFSLTQRVWGWKNRGGKLTPSWWWKLATGKIQRSKFETVVLSSEFFSELSFEKISKLHSDIKNRKVEVVFTIRPLAKLLGSSYQQYLKYGTKADYSDWLHSVLDEVGKSKINPTFWMRHKHGEVISRWADVLGIENVKIIVADETRPNLIYDSMADVLGISPGVLMAQTTGSNRSLSVEELSVLLEINRNFPKEREWSEYLAFIRNGYVRELTDKIPVNQSHSRLLTPRWAVEKANQVASLSKQQIRDLGVTVYGNLDSLDSAEVSEGEPKYSESIDIGTVAKVILSYQRSNIKRFPVRWLLAELKRRVVFIFRKKT